MPYKLISLVFLLTFFIINKAYSENEFILPVKKPSIFKKIENKVSTQKIRDLPQKKPTIKSEKPKKIVVDSKKQNNQKN